MERNKKNLNRSQKQRRADKWVKFYYAIGGVPALIACCLGCYGRSGVCVVPTFANYVAVWVLLVIIVLNIHLYLINKS